MSNLAVAANPPVLTGTAPAPAGDSSPTVAPADVAGGSDKAFITWPERSLRVDGIEPVEGWSLYQYEERDGDGFITPGYFASNGQREVFFDHCRFHFCPTQERFEYLVLRGFPRLGGIGPTQNKHIDDALRNERAPSHTKHGLSAAQTTAIAWVLSA